MKNFGTKIDNDETSAGVVVADEYNSAFSEMKGAVSPFLNLNEQDNQQLAKSIDIASKAMFYNDVGTPNAVHLTRGATNEQIETLFDGMVVFFSPANANTGASTLKVNGLGAKAMKFNNSALVAGMLLVGVKYIAVYKLSDDSFHIDVVAVGEDPSKSVVESDGVAKTKDGKNLTGNIGDIIIRPANLIPSDYLECNGAYISKTTFADLYAVVGTSWGDGGTTFKIPDYRGIFLRGWDNGAGNDTGRVLGSYQSDAMQQHYHDLTFLRDYNVGGANRRVSYLYDKGNGIESRISGGVYGANSSSETRPKNVSVMYCIKY